MYGMVIIAQNKYIKTGTSSFLNGENSNYLWHENEAECSRGTKYDENGNNDETSIFLLV